LSAPFQDTFFRWRKCGEYDPVDQSVTGLLFVLNFVFVGLGVWGAMRPLALESFIPLRSCFSALFIVIARPF